MWVNAIYCEAVRYGMEVLLFLSQFHTKMKIFQVEKFWKKYINLVPILWNHYLWHGKEIPNASVKYFGFRLAWGLEYWNEVAHDSPVKYLSSVPERKFKRIANELNSYKHWSFNSRMGLNFFFQVLFPTTRSVVFLPNNQLHKLQRIQNAAARLICNVGRFEHIPPPP